MYTYIYTVAIVSQFMPESHFDLPALMLQLASDSVRAWRRSREIALISSAWLVTYPKDAIRSESLLASPSESESEATRLARGRRLVRFTLRLGLLVIRSRRPALEAVAFRSRSSSLRPIATESDSEALDRAPLSQWSQRSSQY